MRVASSSTEIKCYDWPDGNFISHYKPNTTQLHPINTISWGKDSGWIILVHSTGIAEIITFKDVVKHIHSIEDFKNLTSATFQNTTKRYIALGTTSGNIKIMDVKAMTVKKSLPRAPSSITKMEFTHKDTNLVAGCTNGKVVTYNLSTAMQTGSFMVPKSKTLTNFKCHPTQTNLIAACSEEGIICIWDMNKSKSIVHSDYHAAPVTDISFNPHNPNWLTCLGMDRRMSILDYRTNKIEQDIKLETSPTAIDISTDGNAFVVGFQNGHLSAYDSRAIRNVLTQFPPHKTSINQVAFENRCTNEPINTASTIETSTEIIFEPPEVFSSPNPAERTEGQTRDSFLDALSLNSTNRSPFLIRKEVTPNSHVRIRKATDVSDVDHYLSPKGAERPLFKSHVENFMKSHKASTPVGGLMQDMATPNMSPIATNWLLQTTVLNELKAFIREVIKEEVDEVKAELAQVKSELAAVKSVVATKEEMEELKFNVIWEMNKRFMDVHMSLVKESIKVEDCFMELQSRGVGDEN